MNESTKNLRYRTCWIMWDHVGKSRLLGIIPTLLVASWLAVRSLAASPAREPIVQGRRERWGSACAVRLAVPRDSATRRFRVSSRGFGRKRSATGSSRRSCISTPRWRRGRKGDASHGSLSCHRRSGVHRVVDRAGAIARGAACGSSTTSRPASAITWPTSPTAWSSSRRHPRPQAALERRAASRWCSTRRRCVGPAVVADPLENHAINVTGTLSVLRRRARPACGGWCTPRRRRSTATGRAAQGETSRPRRSRPTPRRS